MQVLLAVFPHYLLSSWGFLGSKKYLLEKTLSVLQKRIGVEWESLKKPLLELIQTTKKEEIVTPHSEKTASKNAHQPVDKIVEKIKHILDTEIQPAVQRDGGFIQFDHYKDGKVYVKLQGACSGCPSAEWTLKQGIEDRFKREIPQILEVVSIP